jgi:hypothetical protein
MEFGIRNSKLGIGPHPPSFGSQVGGWKSEIRDPKFKLELWRKK